MLCFFYTFAVINKILKMLFVTTLPNDIARCYNFNCNKKHKCLRFLDRMNGRVRNNYDSNNYSNQIKPKVKQ